MTVRISAEVTVTDQTDATALVMFYQLSSSATKPSKPATTDASATPSGWSKAEPSFDPSQGTRYLYMCLQTVWGDGTCDWGDVQLSSSYEQAKAAWNAANAAQAGLDGLEIGGRNLLQGTATWSAWKDSAGATISGEELSYTTNNTHNRLAPAVVVPGETYTLSVDMYADEAYAYGETGNAPILLDYSSTESYTRVTTAWVGNGTALTTSWQRYSYTFAVPSNDSIGWAFVSMRNVSSDPPTYHMRHMKLERGNKATDWTIAPEDIDDAVGAANAEEQTIYKSAASGTTTMSGTTTWVSDVTGAQATWTIKRPEYSQSYPVLFVATQRKAVGGTVTCTTPMIDATTTVIDGGNIITGTVTANQLNATSINASNSLTIGALATDTQSDILNSNVVVGGRNLLRGTVAPVIGTAVSGSTPPPQWYVVSGGTGTGTIETIADSPLQGMTQAYRISGNSDSGNKDFAQNVDALQASWTGSAWDGTTFTFSAWVRGVGASCKAQLRCYGNAANMTYTQNVTTDWTYITKTFQLSGAHTTAYERILFGISGAGEIEYVAPKLERGNKPTDWTPAPEDIAAQSALDDMALDIYGSDDVESVFDQISNVAEQAESYADDMRDELREEVSETLGGYVTTGQYGEDMEDVNDQLGSVDGKIKDSVDALDTELREEYGETKESVIALGSYIDINPGEVEGEVPSLTLGHREGGLVKAILTNEKLSFDTTQAGEVAYIGVDSSTNDGVMAVTHAQVDDLRLGTWQWQQRQNGHLTLKYLG